MDTLRTEIARRLEQERSEYARLMKSLEQLYLKGALQTEGGESVFVEGASNLVASESDRQRLGELLKTLEEKEKVVELLNAYLDVKTEAVRVVIGLDEALPSMRNLVLFGSPPRMGGKVMGLLSSLGPTPIDYNHPTTTLPH